MNKYIMNEDNESLFVRRTAFRDFRSFYTLIVYIDIEKKKIVFHKKKTRHSLNAQITKFG